MNKKKPGINQGPKKGSSSSGEYGKKSKKKKRGGY